MGLLSAVFMATAPFHIYYSQEVRMYSMTCFLAALSMFFFMKIEKTLIKKLKDCFSKEVILWFVTTAFLLYSDYFGFLVLAAQALILWINRKFEFLLICLFAYLLVFIPWLPMLIAQLKTGIISTQTLPEWGKLVNLSFAKALPLTFIKFSIGRITIFNNFAYGAVALLLAVVYLSISVKAIKEKLVIVWFLMPLALAWAASLWVPNFQPFRLLLILPAFYLLLALGIGLLKNKRIQILAVVFILAVNLFSSLRYFLNPYFHREDWKGLVNFLKAQENPLVVLPSNTSDWPIRYYDSTNKVKLVYGSEGVNKVTGNQLQLAVIDSPKIFCVRYLVSLFDPEERILADLEEKGYTKVKEMSFNQIEVWEYQK